jgi:hypothetical protein
MERAARLDSLEDYVRVGEAASILGVTTKTLRNWDRAGKVKTRRHPVNGYRVYSREDLHTLLNPAGPDRESMPDELRPIGRSQLSLIGATAVKNEGDTGTAKAQLVSSHWHGPAYGGDAPATVSLQHEPWHALLTDAGPRDHIVQLYQDQQFLNRAVCRFAAGALANGEGVILVPTLAHWDAFCPRLMAEGVDVKAVQASGQLSIVDADELLPQFMRDGMPDAPVFMGLASEVVAKARAGDRYPKVRWWGEMVNLLWERGDVAASMNLEDQFDQLAHQHDIAIFCSFVMDNFDSQVHTRMLPRLGQNHSHLIPVEDYARLESAVTEALRETVGSDEARILEEQLLSRFPSPFQMPRSQALLLALRESLPAVADSVLARSRTYYNPVKELAK